MGKWTVTAQDVPELLAKLACSDPETQQSTLRHLCPCRSRCDDRAIWSAICRAYDDMTMSDHVRHQAHHALETLVDYAQRGGPAQETLQWLLEERLLWLPLEKPDGRRRPEPARESRHATKKITSRDVPRLLATLDCGDPHAQKHTLQLLCPCRNRRYDQEVWLAIFRAYERGETGGVRDQAYHAIETLLTRARTDPRSQELLCWLAEQGVTSLPLLENVPSWIPNLRGGGLYIPRYERSPRSRANRRR
jgi:hypothetical protein